tara:strand:- start:59229 stop:60515 length:1287 start_codon:yes stop_codon:yes gene_type:complete
MLNCRAWIVLQILLFSFWAGADSLSCGSFYRLVKPVLSYGLEIEFTASRHPELLNDYRPYHTSEKKWLSFPMEKRMQIVESQVTKDRVNTLVRMSMAPAWAPEFMDREGHGTFEANSMIFSDLFALKQGLSRMGRRYGKGSAQVHVVFDRNEVKASHTGFITFSADRAQLRNLVLGYGKYQQDKSKIPAANIMHYVLGPMTASGEEATATLDRKIAKGEYLSDDTGGKYYLSTVLRAGVYGKDSDLVGYELRQFNFDHEGLVQEVEHVSHVIQNKKIDRFNRFAGSIETKEVIWARIADEYGSAALRWKEKLNVITPKDSNLMLAILFFMRDWKKHPIIETLPGDQKIKMRTRLIELQGNLLLDLNAIMDRPDLRSKEKLYFVRIAVAKWASDTGLLYAFDDFEQSVSPEFFDLQPHLLRVGNSLPEK